MKNRPSCKDHRDKNYSQDDERDDWQPIMGARLLCHYIMGTSRPLRRTVRPALVYLKAGEVLLALGPPHAASSSSTAL